MPARPTLTIAEVIERFDLSRATVRRGIENGKFPHATKDTHGRWTVPVDDLIAAQVSPRKTWLTEHAHEGGHPAQHEHAQSMLTPAQSLNSLVATELAHTQNEHAHELAHRDTRIAQLEAQLATETRLKEAAERNAEDLRAAMRVIEAKPQHNTTSEAPKRKRWWHPWGATNVYRTE